MARRLRLGVFGAVALLALAGAGLAWPAWKGAPSDEPFELLGARPGMTQDDVREHFRPPRRGTYRAETGKDPKLVWTATGGPPEEHVVFEFHGGLLVAIRARLKDSDPALAVDPIRVTETSVLTRSSDGDGTVQLTWLSRLCPVHKAEANAAAERARAQ